MILRMSLRKMFHKYSNFRKVPVKNNMFCNYNMFMNLFLSSNVMRIWLYHFELLRFMMISAVMKKEVLFSLRVKSSFINSNWEKYYRPLQIIQNILWIRCKTSRVYTFRPIGSRMGRGKGQLKSYYFYTSSCNLMFQLNIMYMYVLFYIKNMFMKTTLLYKLVNSYLLNANYYNFMIW